MHRASPVRRWSTLPLKNSRAIAACFFALAALLFMIVSAYCLRWNPSSNDFLPVGGIFAVCGGLSLLTALVLNSVSTTDAITITNPDNKPTWLLVIPGMLALALLVEINAGVLGIAALREVPLSIQLGLLVLAVVLLTLGLGGLRLRRASDTAPATLPEMQTAGQSLRYTLLLLLIVALAFAVRAWNLDLEVHKFVDEVLFASGVTELRISTHGFQLLAPFNTITAFPWLYPYLQSWFADLGGRNLESLRWISVILGTLGIPALYLLAKTLFDRKTALIAALLLATFPPHIQFSRIGINNIADPLFGTLAIAFLARGLKQGGRMNFALAGASLGLTQYFYEGGRFLYPMLIVCWLAWFPLARLLKSIFNRRTSRFIQTPSSPTVHYNLLPTFILTAALIGLPIYLTLMALQHPIDLRFQTVGVGGSYWFKVQKFGGLQTPEQQLLRPVLIYVNLPESAQYYGGEQPLLLPYIVVFFLLGLFWLLWRWRALSIILLPWLVMTSLGNMLLTDGAISARYVVAFPALILIVSVGIRYVLPMIWPFVPHGKPQVQSYIALTTYALAFFFAVAQVAYYFGPHLTTYNRQIRPYYDSEDAIFRAADLPGETMVHIVSDHSLTEGYLSSALSYLADNKVVTVHSPSAISTQYLSTLPRNVSQAFFIEPTDNLTRIALQQTYSLSLKGPYTSPYPLDPSKQLLLYFVPDILHS